MNEPVFLLRESVLAPHRRSLEAHGGMDGLRDPIGIADKRLDKAGLAALFRKQLSR